MGASRQPREWRKTVAHGASRGKNAIIKSPVKGDRIPAGENFLSPLRGSDCLYRDPRLAPWATFHRCSAAIRQRSQEL